MSTRAQLQTKSIAELRQIAEAVGVESDGLQKSKLISALMAAGGMTDDGEEASIVDLPTATARSDETRSGDFGPSRRPPSRNGDSDRSGNSEMNGDSDQTDENRAGEVLSGDESSDMVDEGDGNPDDGAGSTDLSDSSEGGPDADGRPTLEEEQAGTDPATGGPVTGGPVTGDQSRATRLKTKAARTKVRAASPTSRIRARAVPTIAMTSEETAGGVAEGAAGGPECGNPVNTRVRTNRCRKASWRPARASSTFFRRAMASSGPMDISPVTGTSTSLPARSESLASARPTWWSGRFGPLAPRRNSPP